GSGPDLLGEGLVDGGEMLGEHKGRAARIRPENDGDRQIGKFEIRISGDDPRVVPFGDLAEEEVRVDIVWQLQVLRTAGQVVSEHDFARGYRQQDDAARDLGDFLVGHRRVAAGKV